MPTLKAFIERRNGKPADIPLRRAHQMLATGEYIKVQTRPLTIRHISVSDLENFEEERCHLSGRIVKGMSRGKSAAKLRGSFNGCQYTSSSTRCRPPRKAKKLSPEARETKRILSDQKRKDGTEGQRAAEEAMASRKAQ